MAGQGTFLELARSLFVGSVKLDELTLHLLPAQIQDEQYHRFQIDNAPTMHALHRELIARVEKAEVPGAMVWEPN